MAHEWNPGRGKVVESPRGRGRDRLSTEIKLSRDGIRDQITEYVKIYLELENVDLTKSSFLSFMINVISTLTGNLMFYQVSTYNEFFLTKAQLPESILNLSAFLGYNTKEAKYATTNLLMTIPLTFQDPTVTFTIPQNFKFYSDDGDVEFITFYTVTITITNNSTATAVLQEQNRRYNLPIGYDTENNTFYFILPVRQYKIIEQEFQIDADLPIYQFVTIDVPLSGKVSTMKVEMRDPGETGFTIWEEVQSLYLLSPTTKGYVSRRTDEGRRLYFGNGLIGVQPTPGATVRVIVSETEGADGNVIAGSIIRGDRIYTVTSAGQTQIVNYNVINTSPAINGQDEESLDEVRSNAISSLSALSRLVTEIDYKNIDVIIEDSPFTMNSYPVLKRSDLKINEIQIFTSLLFGNDLVPTRNTHLEIPITTSYIPRGSIIPIDSVDYYTLFDMTLELINSVAYYHYIMYEIEQIPSLVTSYSSTYNMYLENIIIKKEDNKAIFQAHYQSTEPDFDTAECILEVATSGITYNMINDATANMFVFELEPYTLLPEGEQTYYFNLSQSGSSVAQYVSKLTFRQPLKSFMLSNTIVDSTSVVIYDIPVIQKEYYDQIVAKDFEIDVLQQLLSSLTLEDYRMLTDFSNVKFTNTTGKMRNMQYNLETRLSVIDIVDTLPLNPNLNDRYILAKGTTNENQIVQCIDETSVTWYYTIPVMDDIIYVENQDIKYIFTEIGWRIAEYNIPLNIEIEVVKQISYTGSINDLTSSIRESLLVEFQNRFGTNVEIYRSEIIEVVQNVEGVDHCRLVKPESSIFFNYKLEDFSEQQLMEYGPEYVYFTNDTITIRVL